MRFLLSFFSLGFSQKIHPSSLSLVRYSIRQGAQIVCILFLSFPSGAHRLLPPDADCASGNTAPETYISIWCKPFITPDAHCASGNTAPDTYHFHLVHTAHQILHNINEIEKPKTLF